MSLASAASKRLRSLYSRTLRHMRLAGRFGPEHKIKQFKLLGGGSARRRRVGRWLGLVPELAAVTAPGGPAVNWRR